MFIRVSFCNLFVQKRFDLILGSPVRDITPFLTPALVSTVLWMKFQRGLLEV